MGDVVTTERLEIVDKMGNCRAILGQQEDQSVGLTLFNEATVKKLELRVRENGNPEVILYEDGGRIRIRIFVNQRGEPKIMLTDGYDTNILKLAVSEDDEPVLELRDSNGRTRVGIFVSDSGTGGIAVFNSSEKLIGSLPKETDLLEVIGTAAKLIGIIRAISGG